MSEPYAYTIEPRAVPCSVAVQGPDYKPQQWPTTGYPATLSEWPGMSVVLVRVGKHGWRACDQLTGQAMHGEPQQTRSIALKVAVEILKLCGVTVARWRRAQADALERWNVTTVSDLPRADRWREAE